MVRPAIERIRAWGEAREWRGYDPYDGLNSPAAGLLSLGTPFGRRLLTQVVKQSPLNLRPVLRIKPELNAKAIALVASAYARLFAATADESARAHAATWLDWLVDNARLTRPGLAWGYHFDVQTRVFCYRRGEPNTIATTFVAQALLDGCEHVSPSNTRWSQAVRDAVTFLAERAYRETPEGGYFRYLSSEDELVHNANVLACAVISRLGDLLGDERYSDRARHALETTLGAQRSDGSWPYAEGAGHGWVDNFHTGYVLESLAVCTRLAPSLDKQLRSGLDYWDTQLFLPDSTPKYFPKRLYPIDAHCYAQAIETWLAVTDIRSDALSRAEDISRLLIHRMLDPTGYIHFQTRRFWTSRVPFIRWSTAPSFRALSGLLKRLAQEAPAIDRRSSVARVD